MLTEVHNRVPSLWRCAPAATCLGVGAASVVGALVLRGTGVLDLLLFALNGVPAYVAAWIKPLNDGSDYKAYVKVLAVLCGLNWAALSAILLWIRNSRSFGRALAIVVSLYLAVNIPVGIIVLTGILGA